MKTKTDQTQVIGRGAEAILTLEKRNQEETSEQSPCTIINSKERKATKHKNEVQYVVHKNRMPKSYRLKELDEKLRKQRTKKEAKVLSDLLGKVNIPKLIKADKFNLEIEYIKGGKLSETLNTYDEKKQFKCMNLLGEQASRMHDLNIIHGDLTTSNTILVENPASNKNNSQLINSKEPLGDFKIRAKHNMAECPKLFIIDFGLSLHSQRIEDKAVDLHLIKQALEAKHFQNHENLFREFLKTYKPKDKEKILEQLKKVESRGRYKH